MAVSAWFGLFGIAAATQLPCRADSGGTCAVVHPSSGPIGTRVSLDGQVDPRMDKRDFRLELSNLRQDPGFLFLMRDVGPPFCEVIGGVDAGHFSVTDTGLIHGSFVVGGSTSCNQSSAPAPPLAPGVYTVNLGCMSCVVSRFEITGSARTLPFTGAGSLWRLVMIGTVGIAGGLGLTTSGRRTTAAA